MSTLQEFLQKTKTRSVLWWLKYYWNNILETIYEKKVSNNVDNSWKNSLRVTKSIYPEGWTRDNAFLHLNKQYQGTIMKRYKD